VRAARDWAAALAKGEFSRVIAEAEARGFANCLDQCSTADVRYLADAARYTRRFELAEQALVTLRRRSSGEAPAAAYLLGVVNESQGRNSAALRWYEQCASEAPRGRYVSEAQAGRLRMLVATGQYETARAAAVRYLKDFPRGVGEATAKKILSD
jgi:tetratricopeptide (TPR) repeat protein